MTTSDAIIENALCSIVALKLEFCEKEIQVTIRSFDFFQILLYLFFLYPCWQEVIMFSTAKYYTIWFFNYHSKNLKHTEKIDMDL